MRGKFPVFTGIVLRDVRVLTPGKVTLDGYDEAHRLEMTFDGVTLGAPPSTTVVAQHALITLGPGLVNFVLAGEDVRVTGKPGGGSPKSCAGKFEPMPKR